MGYDLDFWAYEDEGAKHDHQAVYERLSDGESVHGVREIPVDKILERLASACSAEGWTALDDRTWDGERGAFQVYTTPQLFRLDCYEMQGVDMNVLVDVGLEFGLRLYDPQVGERFGPSNSATTDTPGRLPRLGGLRGRLAGLGRRHSG